MKQISVIFYIVFFLFLNQGIKSQTNDEAEIKIVALDYIEGWYSADTIRMGKALDPSLKKRGFLINHQTKELDIHEASYEQMIEWTGNKPNQLEDNPDIPIEVHIIEIGENIAMVKTITPDFIDYLHLGKLDDEWKIYNAVWERPMAK